MYTINNLHPDIIELENSNQSSYAKINLTLGASLQELVLNSHTVIEDVSPLTYNNTYASSILFPFANRIKDGHYTFEGNSYQFDINETGNNNALHGLVYNKTFKIKEQNTSDTAASVTLIYVEKKESNGFPYTYTIHLKYTLTETGLEFKVLVTNTDTKAFPFTLGWHPYFRSANLYNSSLHFDSDTQLVFDNRCITTGTKPFKNTSAFEIKDQQLDDCFILNSNKIQFNTPNYKLQISASSKETFLQIYTPPKANVIAIEPTTGVSDSFNNQMGLQTLNPDENYLINWQLTLI